MIKAFIATAAAASLLAGAAIAQTDTSPTKTPSNMKSPAAAQSGPPAQGAVATGDMNTKGISMAKTASMAVRFVQQRPADLMASQLIGLEVYNNQNEKLGEIEDISVENGKTLTGVVVSVGGFLGMNERYVMVDPATIVVNKDGDDWKAFVDTSRDTLKSAPKFEYSERES
jgi:sporulation protein YlmC with PRC-barrel domain